MRNEPRIGQVFPIVFEFYDQTPALLNLNGLESARIHYKKPDDSGATVLSGDWSADLVSDGSDGRIQYVASVGDLDVSGEWEFQAFVTLGGVEYPSDIHRKYIYPNL